MYFKLCLSSFILFLSVLITLYPNKFNELTQILFSYVNNNLSSVDGSTNDDRLFEDRELAKYHGGDNSKGLYISILGNVYDVEKGSKHYGPGGTYHVFAGRDASKAFITGEFESKLDLDDVLSLTNRDLLAIHNWKSFYGKEYKYVGKLIGRFYDRSGIPTEYLRKVYNIIEEAQIEKNEQDFVKWKYPPCNSEWKADQGTKVWCTTKSGGIERDWVGVPRKLYEPGKLDYRCACVENPKEVGANFKEFEDCGAQETSCLIKNYGKSEYA